jgi:hypothetical protein
MVFHSDRRHIQVHVSDRVLESRCNEMAHRNDGVLHQIDGSRQRPV